MVVSSDHSFTSIGFCQATKEELNGILQKSTAKESISNWNGLKYETALLTQLAKGTQKETAMQLHFWSGSKHKYKNVSKNR